MKRLVLTMVMVCAVATQAWAFLYQVKILTKDEISKLSEVALVEVYTGALIERKASETFHGKAGFNPQEYESFKNLLGFIVRLRQEMLNRKVDAPPIDEWLK